MRSLELQDFYDKEYFQKRGFVFPGIKGFAFSLFINFFLRPKTLLDVGCGEGTLVKWATRWGIDSWGVDISSAGFLKAKKFVRERCRVDDILKLSYKDKMFEVVTSLAVMEHIKEKDTTICLNELLRISQKYVLLQICVCDNPFEREGHYLSDPTHVNIRTSSWWLKKIKELGIKNVFSIPRAGLFLLKK